MVRLLAPIAVPIASLALAALGCSSPSDTDTDSSGTETSSESSSSETDSETSADSEIGDADAGDGDGDGDGDADIEPNCEGDLEPGEYNRDVTIDGVERRYRLWIPANYDPSASTPLVLNYHGYGSTAGQQVFFTFLNDYADEQGFMVAYPEGLENTDGSQAHDAGSCCADNDGRDDLAFARALIDATTEETCIDKRRIFSTGMSNGGYMSYRLACDASDIIAAVAPVSGAFGVDPADCTPERPVPLLAFNGTADLQVPISAANQSIALYTALLNCPELPPSEEVFGSVTCSTYSSCEADTEVIYCSAESMSHCWPGTEFCLDPPSTLDVSANEMMWEFFQAHPMPE